MQTFNDIETDELLKALAVAREQQASYKSIAAKIIEEAKASENYQYAAQAAEREGALIETLSAEIKTRSALRPLSDNEKIAIEFIRQTPRCTVEDVLNFMVPFDHADEIRSEIASAVGYLISNGYVEKNKANSALVISETPPK